ncbi:YheC/YheD family protein [Alicyclobacillus sp. SO9]|uniref:YheC/YheD family protein n=1 Tax=Alicyclobacillus sp. SO9 TaxID=2665646 RepID=UPI0018E8D70D|nr:YheC/YheD family protein [Alicyclobacillus sp. SO9]QQE78745.1 YheC/YheD family protein [Alicyclobacillus sp. SO9]
MPRAQLDVQRQGLNKWEMHKALLNGLSNKTDCSSFRIPETKLGTPGNLADMLRNHQTVFIKPVNAWGGSGITRVDVDTSHPVLYRWHKQGDKQVLHIDSVGKVIERFLSSYTAQPVIVQAGAPLATLDERPFDIRVLMQRNDEEDWVYSGAVGRVGGAGSVVSNIALSRGHVMDLKELCHELNCKQKVQQTLSENLQETGYAIAKIVEQYRDFFDIGIDVGLSSNKSLWLIEVNTDDALGGPSHELFAQLPNRDLYDEIQNRHRATRNRRGQALLRELF